VLGRVLIREVSLPDVCLPLAAGAGRGIAPDVRFAVESAASRELPLGLGRQALARPLCKGDRVVPRNMNYGMVISSVDGRARSFGMPPARAGRPLPPLRDIVERNRNRRRYEH